MPSPRPSAAERRHARERFATASRLENEYARRLRLLTQQIDGLVRMHSDRPQELASLLEKYSATIEPWARSVASQMVQRVASKDEEAWTQLGQTIGRELRKELQNAPTGHALRSFMEKQVELIQSLPKEAAERVLHVTGAALVEGRRADSIARDILETSNVTASRARLIARTETARMASGLTMVRAQHVGSTHYVWRTAGDGDVRESHKKMNGRVIAWATPEEVDPGKRYHAGQFPNCRCYPEPILPDT